MIAHSQRKLRGGMRRQKKIVQYLAKYHMPLATCSQYYYLSIYLCLRSSSDEWCSCDMSVQVITCRSMCVFFSVDSCRHRFGFFFALTASVRVRLIVSFFSFFLLFRMRGVREMRTATAGACTKRRLYKTVWHSTEHFDKELTRARSNRNNNTKYVEREK